MKIETIGTRVGLWVCDTAGNESYRRNTAARYRGASGVLILYDIASRPSFEKAASIYFPDAHTHAPQASSILVGTKCDLESQREVPFGEGKALADSLGIKFVEASAKTSHNVSQVFGILAAEILARGRTQTEIFRLSPPRSPPRRQQRDSRCSVA